QEGDVGVVVSEGAQRRAGEDASGEGPAIAARPIVPAPVPVPSATRPAGVRLPVPGPLSAAQPRAKPAPPPAWQEGAATDLPTRKAQPAAQESASGLSARLMALARMIQIGSARKGRDGFGAKVLADAEGVLARAGDRMRLSSSHTVVVLAGGTGSGKSSLFNRIAGADFSPVGVTRPVTKEAHACVWGDGGSDAILEWLDVPPRYRYSRASAPDQA